MNALRIASGIILGVACSAAVPAGLLAAGPDPSGGSSQATGDAGSGKAYTSLADLDAAYAQQMAALERKRLADLTGLARRATGSTPSESIGRHSTWPWRAGYTFEAEPAARAYLSRETGEPENHALAASIALISRAERGEFDQSLDDLKEFLAHRATAKIPDESRLPGAMVLCRRRGLSPPAGPRRSL